MVDDCTDASLFYSDKSEVWYWSGECLAERLWTNENGKWSCAWRWRKKGEIKREEVVFISAEKTRCEYVIADSRLYSFYCYCSPNRESRQRQSATSSIHSLRHIRKL